MSNLPKIISVAVIALMMAASAVSAVSLSGMPSDTDGSGGYQTDGGDPRSASASADCGDITLQDILGALRGLGDADGLIGNTDVLVINGLTLEITDGTGMVSGGSYILKADFQYKSQITVPQGQSLFINLNSTFKFTDGAVITVDEGGSLAVGYAITLSSKYYGAGVSYTCGQDHADVTLSGTFKSTAGTDNVYNATTTKGATVTLEDPDGTYVATFVDGLKSRFKFTVSLLPTIISHEMNLKTGKVTFSTGEGTPVYTLDECKIVENANVKATLLNAVFTGNLTEVDIRAHAGDSYVIGITASGSGTSKFRLNLSDLKQSVYEMLKNLEGTVTSKTVIDIDTEPVEGIRAVVSNLEITSDLTSEGGTRSLDVNAAADRILLGADMPGGGYGIDAVDCTYSLSADLIDGCVTATSVSEAFVYDGVEHRYSQLWRDMSAEGDLELGIDFNTGVASFSFGGSFGTEAYLNDLCFASFAADDLAGNGRLVFGQGSAVADEGSTFDATGDFRIYAMGVDFGCSDAQVKVREGSAAEITADSVTFSGDIIPCGFTDVDRYLIGFSSVDGSAGRIKVTVGAEGIAGGPETLDMTVGHDNGAVTKYTGRHSSDKDVLSIDVSGGYAKAVDAVVAAADEVSVSGSGKLFVAYFVQDAFRSGTVYVGSDRFYLVPSSAGETSYDVACVDGIELQLSGSGAPITGEAVGLAFRYDAQTKAFTLVSLDGFTDTVSEAEGFVVDPVTKAVSFTGSEITARALPKTFVLTILNPDGSVYEKEEQASLFAAIVVEVPENTVCLRDGDGNTVGGIVIDDEDGWYWVYMAEEEGDSTVTLIIGETIQAPSVPGTSVSVEQEAFAVEVSGTGSVTKYMFSHVPTGLDITFQVGDAAFREGDMILMSASMTTYDGNDAYEIHCNGPCIVSFPASSDKCSLWHVVDGKPVEVKGTYGAGRITATLHDYSVYYVSQDPGHEDGPSSSSAVIIAVAAAAAIAAAAAFILYYRKRASA